MVEVVVTGIGLISSLGKGLESSWQHLIHGKSGIRLMQPFLELEPLPLALINQVPTDLTELTHLVVAAALEDAGLVPPLPNCGVVIGSSRSHQAAWEQLAKFHPLTPYPKPHNPHPPTPIFKKTPPQQQPTPKIISGGGGGPGGAGGPGGR